MPPANAQSTAARSRLYFFSILGLGLILGLAQLPLLSSGIILIVTGFALIVVLSVLQIRKASDARQRRNLQSTAIFTIAYISLLAGCVVLAHFAVTSLVSRLIFDPELGAGLNIALSIVVGFVFFRLLFASPVLSVYHGPLKHANYDGALNRVNFYLRAFPFYSSLLYLKAFVLTLAGRYDEAAASWTEILTITQNTGSLFSALCLVNLGSCQATLGNHEGALRLIETAISVYGHQSRPPWSGASCAIACVNNKAAVS